MDTQFYQSKLQEIKDIQQQRKLKLEEEFMMYRIQNFLDAIRLNLKYFKYSGGVTPDSLSFCIERNNKVFSIKELLSWKDAPHRPLDVDYDPILNLGANKCFKGESFCNHNIRFMSNSAAKRYRSDVEIIEESDLENVDLTNVDPDILILIANKKRSLLKNASPIQTILINSVLDQFTRDLANGNIELVYNGKDISIVDALNLITKTFDNS